MIAAPPNLVALPGDAGVSIVILAGVAPGLGELFVYVAEDGGVRTLWPVHGLPARLPERPLMQGQPHIPNLVRAFVAGLYAAAESEADR